MTMTILLTLTPHCWRRSCATWFWARCRSRSRSGTGRTPCAGSGGRRGGAPTQDSPANPWDCGRARDHSLHRSCERERERERGEGEVRTCQGEVIRVRQGEIQHKQACGVSESLLEGKLKGGEVSGAAAKQLRRCPDIFQSMTNPYFAAWVQNEATGGAWRHPERCFKNNTVGCKSMSGSWRGLRSAHFWEALTWRGKNKLKSCQRGRRVEGSAVQARNRACMGK